MKKLNAAPDETMFERMKRLLMKPDLLTTRLMIGISSLIFAGILSFHFMNVHHWHDIFWVAFSLIHATITFYSLFFDKLNKITFIGEAIFGFVLWNYISLSVMLTYSGEETNFSPAGAPFAPTFVIGI